MRVLKPYDILISISEDDRDMLYNKRLKTPTGELLSTICVDMPNEFGSDPAFSQDVNIARVEDVGSAVTGIGIGDLVIIDYLVDTTPNFVIEEAWAGKTCVLDTRTQYYDETKKVPANRNTKVGTFVYKKGEMKSYSLVIASIKGSTVIPNSPYIFLEHKKDEDPIEVSGIQVKEPAKHVIERKVLFTYLGCKIEAGLIALVESDFIFQRRIGENVFDVCFHSDIVGFIEQNL